LISYLSHLIQGRQIGFLLLVFVIFLTIGVAARADSGAFDLIGPKVDVRVQRAGVTLPIAQVPNSQVGDRL
jgi:hypothetical protein